MRFINVVRLSPCLKLLTSFSAGLKGSREDQQYHSVSLATNCEKRVSQSLKQRRHNVGTNYNFVASSSNISVSVWCENPQLLRRSVYPARQFNEIASISTHNAIISEGALCSKCVLIEAYLLLELEMIGQGRMHSIYIVITDSLPRRDS